MFSRREFVRTAGTTAFCAALPLKLAFANPLVAIAVKAVATSAGEYIGGALLHNILGGGSDMVTNEDILNAIKSSTEEIKRHVSQETRAAITEDRVRELQAACTSILGKLNSYAAAEPASQSGALYLLQDADVNSRDAVALAGKLGAPGLIPYSILVSLRIMVAKALVDFNGAQEIFRNFSNELRGHVANIRSGYMDYRQTLIPHVRLTDFGCVTRETGGGFPIRELICTFKVDGQTITAAEGFSPGGSGDVSISSRAVQMRDVKQRELLDFQLKIDKEIGSPLLDAADEWELIANDILPGVISLTNRARGRIPKPGIPTPSNTSNIPTAPAQSSR